MMRARPRAGDPVVVLGTIVLLLAGLVAVILALWASITGSLPSADCAALWTADGEGSLPCRTEIEIWRARLGSEFAALATLRLLPIVVGLVLGSYAGRSARSVAFLTVGGWRGWLRRRVVPALVVLVVTLGALSVAATLYEGVRMPALDPLASFNEYGIAGLSVLARGLAAFAVAVAAWVLVGRWQAALALSFVLSWLVLWGTTEAFPYGAETEWLSEREAIGTDMASDIGLEVAWRADDGSTIAYQAARDLAPDAGWIDWAEMRYEEVQAYLPGSRFPEVQAREAAMLGLITLLALGLAAIAMARRRATPA